MYTSSDTLRRFVRSHPALRDLDLADDLAQRKPELTHLHFDDLFGAGLLYFRAKGGLKYGSVGGNSRGLGPNEILQQLGSCAIVQS